MGLHNYLVMERPPGAGMEVLAVVPGQVPFWPPCPGNIRSNAYACTYSTTDGHFRDSPGLTAD